MLHMLVIQTKSSSTVVAPCQPTEAVLMQLKTLYSASVKLRQLDAACQRYFHDSPMKLAMNPFHALPSSSSIHATANLLLKLLLPS